MTQEDKDLCESCKHYWTDFPRPLDSVVPHCEKVDEKYGFRSMEEYAPYPCLKCPFDCYLEKLNNLYKE